MSAFALPTQHGADPVEDGDVRRGKVLIAQLVGSSPAKIRHLDRRRRRRPVGEPRIEEQQQHALGVVAVKGGLQDRPDDLITVPASAVAEDEDDELDAPGTPGSPEPPWIPGQETLQQPLWTELSESMSEASGHDDMYQQAVSEVRLAGRASVSLLQRRLRIGYTRAARLIDQMEEDGIVGPDLGGSRGRELITASNGDDEE